MTHDELATACTQLVRAVQHHVAHEGGSGGGHHRRDGAMCVHASLRTALAQLQPALHAQHDGYAAAGTAGRDNGSNNRAQQQQQRHVDPLQGVATRTTAMATTTPHDAWYTTAAAWSLVLGSMYVRKRKLRELALACVDCLLQRCPHATVVAVLRQYVTLCTSTCASAAAAPSSAAATPRARGSDRLAATTRVHGSAAATGGGARAQRSLSQSNSSSNTSTITGAQADVSDAACCVTVRAGDGACMALSRLLLMTMQDAAATVQLRLLQLLHRLLTLRDTPPPHTRHVGVYKTSNDKDSSSSSSSSSDDDDDDDMTTVVVPCQGQCLLQLVHATMTLSCSTSQEQVRLRSQRVVELCVVRTTRMFLRDAVVDVASSDAVTAATAGAAAATAAAGGEGATGEAAAAHVSCRAYGDSLTTLTLLDDYVHEVRPSAPYTRIDVCDHLPGCIATAGTVAAAKAAAAATAATTSSSSLAPNARESGDGCVTCKRRCRTLLDGVAEATLALVRLDGQLPQSLKDMLHVLRYMCATAAAAGPVSSSAGGAYSGGYVANTTTSALRARLLALRALACFADELPVANCAREHRSAQWLHVVLFACKYALVGALARSIATATPFALYDAAVRVLTRLWCTVHHHLAAELYTLLAVLVLPLAASPYASFRHTHAVLTMARTLLSTPHVCVSLFVNYDANPCCDAEARYGGVVELLLAFVAEVLFRERVSDDSDEGEEGGGAAGGRDGATSGGNDALVAVVASSSSSSSSSSREVNAQAWRLTQPDRRRRVCRDAEVARGTSNTAAAAAAAATTTTTSTAAGMDDAATATRSTLLTSDQQQLLRSECVVLVRSYIHALHRWLADEPRVYAQRVHDEAARQHAAAATTTTTMAAVAAVQPQRSSDEEVAVTAAADKHTSRRAHTARHKKQSSARLSLSSSSPLALANELYLYDDDDDDGDGDGEHKGGGVTGYHATLLQAAMRGVLTRTAPATASSASSSSLTALLQPWAGGGGVSVYGAQSLLWCADRRHTSSTSCPDAVSAAPPCAQPLLCSSSPAAGVIGYHWKHIHHRLHNKRIAHRALQLFNDGHWQQASALLHAHRYVDCDKDTRRDNNNNNDDDDAAAAANTTAAAAVTATTTTASSSSSCTCLARFMHDYPGISRDALCALFDRVNKPDAHALRQLLRDYLRLFAYADVPIDRALRDTTCTFVSWDRPMFEAQVWATIQEMFGSEYARQNPRAMTAKDADTMAGVLLFLHANAHNASARGDRMTCGQFVQSGNACLDFALDESEMRAMYTRVCRRAWCLDVYGRTPQQAERAQRRPPVRISALLLHKASARAQSAFAAAAAAAAAAAVHQRVSHEGNNNDDNKKDSEGGSDVVTSDSDRDVDAAAQKQCTAWLSLDEETLQEVAAMTTQSMAAAPRRGSKDAAAVTSSPTAKASAAAAATARHDADVQPALSTLQMLDTRARDVVQLIDVACVVPPDYCGEASSSLSSMMMATTLPSSPLSMTTTTSLAGAAQAGQQQQLQQQQQQRGRSSGSRASAATLFTRAAHTYLRELQRVHYVLYTTQAEYRPQPYAVPHYAAHVRPMFLAAYPQLMACLYMGLRVMEEAPLLQQVQSALHELHTVAAALALDLSSMRGAVDETVAHYLRDAHAYRMRPPTRSTFVTYLCNLP